MPMWKRLLRQVESPPVWLVLCIVLAALQRAYWPLLPTGPALDLAGFAVMLAGLAIMALAFVEFGRSKTTILPREVPGRLITGGIYRLSRNPIYLADVLILLGLVLRWDLASLPLVPALAAILQTRFILGEEAGCARAFGADWDRYAERVRRWL